MAMSHSEMAHVLGLIENPLLLWERNTRWNVSSALKSVQKRYSRIKDKPNSLSNFSMISSQSLQSATQNISKMSSGDYLGFASRWWSLDFSRLMHGERIITGHAYSLHAVKEGNKTHFIYVNRGERHYNPDGSQEKDDADTVMVFSVENKEAKNFARRMLNAAGSFNSRSAMSKFLNQNEDKINTDLSSLLKKKNQGTENCTVANTNIAWHFQLASDEMKKQLGKSFASAYEETQSTYREMRVKDRIEAFNYLLNSRNSYLSEEAYLYNYLQSLAKFAVKDHLAAQDANSNKISHIASLVESLNDDHGLLNLINPLLSNQFAKNIEKYSDTYLQQLRDNHTDISKEDPQNFKGVIRNNLFKARDKVLGHALKKISPELQINIIEKDVSLLRHASIDVQKHFLDQDFNRYALYAAVEAKQIYQENTGVNESKYFDPSIEAIREQKISTNVLLSHNSEKKEVDINNKLAALYSYASAGDKIKAGEAFKDLSLTCCERRFRLMGGAYSTDTQSAQWLIAKLSEPTETAKNLRELLDIKNPNEIQGKLAEFIEEKNTAGCISSARFKDRLNSIVEHPDNNRVDELASENTSRKPS